MQNKSRFDNGFIGVYPLVSVSRMSRKSMQNGVIYFLPDFIVKGHFCHSKTVQRGKSDRKEQENALFLIFFAQKFGHVKKKQYFCTRFRKRSRK